MPNTSLAQHEGRIGKLEGTMEQLAKDIQATNNSLQQLAKTTNESIQGLTVKLDTTKDDILQQMTKAAAPKWPAITGIIASILTFLLLVGSLAAFVLTAQNHAIQRNEKNIQQLSEWRLEHVNCTADLKVEIARIQQQVENCSCQTNN